MNNKKIKLIILILFIVTLFLSIIGVTFSYFQNTGTLTNNFQAGDYSTSATESFVSPNNWLPGDTTPKTVIVTNEGDITQGVRIKIEESWLDSSDNELPLEKDGVKAAIINFANPDDWERDGDYYYYKEALEPGESTSSLIESVTFNKDIVTDPVCTTTNGQTTCQNTYNGYENATYKLNIIIQTIQYEFMDPEWDEDAGTLYAVLRDEYRSNSGYAALYTGEHQDSFDRPATKKIYYYTTQQNNTTQGNILLDKINVLFAGYCWQMLRTTDTGGVKMIYNGVPVDGQCTNSTTRNTNGLNQGGRTTNNMNASYAYGSDFTYDLDAGTFKIAGTIKENINYSSDKSVIGYYTCKNVDKDATCTTLYYLEEESATNTSPYSYPFTISSTNYAGIGTTPFNTQYSSLSHLGYMYNKAYKPSSLLPTNIQSYTYTCILLNKSTITTNWYYADSVDMGNTNVNQYTLINPTQWESGVTNLAGKYAMNGVQNGSSVYYIEAVTGTYVYYRTFTNSSISTNYYFGDIYDYDETTTNKYTIHNAIQWTTNVDVTGKYITNGTSSSSIRYILGMEGDRVFYEELSSGHLLKYNDSLIVGETITDNRNGTYTLNNPTAVTYQDWAINNENYKYKYTCGGTSITCKGPIYIAVTGAFYYDFIRHSDEILISKTRNGLELTDTLIVAKEELSKNGSNYLDYKYTCNTLSSTCTENTLGYIIAYEKTYYRYIVNKYYGEGVTWDGTKYILNNMVALEGILSLEDLSTHHYTCVTPGQTECTSVAYMYYVGNGTGGYVVGNNMYYITFENGVETVSEALDEMLYGDNVNLKDSAIKRIVDEWYYNSLLEYDNYLEETIYCNDRSLREIGGWEDNGDLSKNLLFKEYTVTSDLKCINETDQFSISNNKAKLKYKIGISSAPEMYLLNNNTARKTGNLYWLASPSWFKFTSYNAIESSLGSSGSLGNGYVNNIGGARPSISLIPGISPSSGSGTMTDPYVIDTSGI